MKAKDYGNSPMLMNFPDSFPGGVGESPAKWGFLKRAAKKIKSLGKKVLGKTPIGKALGIDKEKKDPSIPKADAVAVAPHTHNPDGTLAIEGEGQAGAAQGGKTDLATVDPNSMTDPILRSAAMRAQGQNPNAVSKPVSKFGGAFEKMRSRQGLFGLGGFGGPGGFLSRL